MILILVSVVLLVCVFQDLRIPEEHHENFLFQKKKKKEEKRKKEKGKRNISSVCTYKNVKVSPVLPALYFLLFF